MNAGAVSAELKRRHVARVGAFHAAAWLLAQVVTQIVPVFAISAWAMRWVIVALAVGFPFALAFAWLYQFTPDGLKRESGNDAADSIFRRTRSSFATARMTRRPSAQNSASRICWKAACSARKQGGQVRITAPLTRVSDDASVIPRFP